MTNNKLREHSYPLTARKQFQRSVSQSERERSPQHSRVTSMCIAELAKRESGGSLRYEEGLLAVYHRGTARTPLVFRHAWNKRGNDTIDLSPCAVISQPVQYIAQSDPTHSEYAKHALDLEAIARDADAEAMETINNLFTSEGEADEESAGESFLEWLRVQIGLAAQGHYSPAKGIRVLVRQP